MLQGGDGVSEYGGGMESRLGGGKPGGDFDDSELSNGIVGIDTSKKPR